ncbi:MAG: helix-turn-helix domain-containing protein [Chloroflexi bacterium]|nr:helix-turn-helix domain-containing protein [Chloroflexota bacterium]
MLLKADEGWDNSAMAAALSIGISTVWRTRKWCVEEGIEVALRDRPRPGQRPKLDGKQEAHLIAVACTKAPEGHARWTLRLLAGKVVELGFTETYSHEAVRRALKKALRHLRLFTQADGRQPAEVLGWRPLPEGGRGGKHPPVLGQLRYGVLTRPEVSQL